MHADSSIYLSIFFVGLNKYSVVIHHNRRLQKYFSDFRFGSYFFLEKKTRSYCKYFFFHRQSSFSAAYPEKKVNPFIDSFFPSMVQNNSHKNEIFMYVWYFFSEKIKWIHTQWILHYERNTPAEWKKGELMMRMIYSACTRFCRLEKKLFIMLSVLEDLGFQSFRPMMNSLGYCCSFRKSFNKHSFTQNTGTGLSLIISQ